MTVTIPTGKLLILENRDLRERLRLERIEKYGPAAERLSDAQLELLELEPGVNAAEVEAEAQRAQLQLALKAKSGDRTRPTAVSRCRPSCLGSNKSLPALKSNVSAANGGKPTVVIGCETAERLDREPAKYFVRVLKREKRACSSCAQGGVQTAALPARIIQKSIVSDRVIIDTVIAKYCDYQPLYRQSAILEREVGLEISRTTMCDWVMQVGELLRPITASMRQELLTGHYLQADETPLMVQVPGLGRNHRAYLWQYSRPHATWYLTSKWDGAVKVRESSLETMKAFYRPTAIALTTKLEEPRLFARAVGVILGASFSRPFRSIRSRSPLLS